MKIPAVLPASATQSEIARAYMTPETAKALPDRVLDAGGPPLMQEKEPTPRTPETMKKMMHEYAVESEHGSRSAGAWNVRGWITFMPDTARMMLTQAGAYHPRTRPAADARLRRAT